MFKYLKLDLNLYSALNLLLISTATNDLSILQTSVTKLFQPLS